MKRQGRVLALIAIMGTVAIAAAGIAIAALYHAAVDVERRRLTESTQSQARWIETMARFEIMNSLRDLRGAEFATLNQFFEAHAGYEVFAETGETVLARREGDQIAFLMRHGTGTLEASDRLPFDFKHAQPMYRALQGLSGTMIGLDHDGVLVLAAYEPVDVLDLGIVSKIDMAEVRAPFIRAGLLVVGISFGLVVAGAWLFVAISRPMIRDLEEHSRHLEQMVHELRESEERFRHTFEQAAVGVAHVTPDGDFVRFNSRFCEITGYTADELKGMRAQQLSHPDDAEAAAAIVARALSGELESFSSERRFVRKDGTTVWVDNTVSLVRDEHGRPRYLIAIVADATARKQGEAELAASQRELALHNAVSEVFLTIPDNQMYEQVLQQVMTYLESRAGIFGYIDDAGDLVVPSMPQSLPERRSVSRVPVIIPRESWGGAWGEALVYRRSVLANRPEPAQPSHPATVRSIVVPIIDRDELIGLLAVANRDRDYSEEHLRELKCIANYVGPILHARLVRDRLERERDAFNRALVTSENRYRAIVQQQTEFVARFLRDGTLTFVNEALCRYSGRDAFELIGQSLWSFVSDEMRLKSQLHLETLTTDRPAGENEITWTAFDGTTRWVSFANTALFDDRGILIEYQSVGRDVTDRHDREVALERALAEKEILLKEIHHRVKNNLQVVSSLLNLQALKLEDETLRRAFQGSQSRIRAMALIHETLYQSHDLSRIELRPYISRVGDSLIGMYDVSADRIRLRVEADRVALTIDDMVPCGLIINELLSNSLKHAFPDNRAGDIRIAATASAEGDITLEIRDNGVGLPDDVDIHDTSTMGMRLVKGLVENQLGGTIEVDRGLGTAFRIVFRPGQRRVGPADRPVGRGA